MTCGQSQVVVQRFVDSMTLPLTVLCIYYCIATQWRVHTRNLARVSPVMVLQLQAYLTPYPQDPACNCCRKMN